MQISCLPIKLADINGTLDASMDAYRKKCMKIVEKHLQELLTQYKVASGLYSRFGNRVLFDFENMNRNEQL